MPESQNPTSTGTSRKETISRIIQALLLSGEKLTDDELRQMQVTTDALERAQAADGHHDHDHPTIVDLQSRVASER